ncbi:hypothetical protein SEA_VALENTINIPUFF_78 [Microbacterium phage ValentiniPuff]|uniref:Uncharacterized protein n=1 Tax=Microbacterium phage ValentiniPuff TaxID=2315705 RepID=A0A386KRZ8_9CAUD|nr:hypothetical protein SEA_VALENTINIPUFF_78 [Microbacterium phage ValentiniPuff]
MSVFCETSSTAGTATGRVKLGDTAPVRWRLPGFNLTGCTVAGAVKRDVVVTALEVTVVDAAAGLVEHPLPNGIAIGTYLVEFEVTETASGEVTHVPDQGYGQLIVEASFA